LFYGLLPGAGGDPGLSKGLVAWSPAGAGMTNEASAPSSRPLPTSM
jgi:hypothetical protein